MSWATADPADGERRSARRASRPPERGPEPPADGGERPEPADRPGTGGLTGPLPGSDIDWP